MPRPDDDIRPRRGFFPVPITGLPNSQLSARAVSSVSRAADPTVEFPAARGLAEQRDVPITGEDLQIGQALLETALHLSLQGRLGPEVGVGDCPAGGNENEGGDDVDAFVWPAGSLAPPILVDFARFLDPVLRAGHSAAQPELSSYLKLPVTAAPPDPEHDLFIQLLKLKGTLRWMAGEEQIAHLGHESDC